MLKDAQPAQEIQQLVPLVLLTTALIILQALAPYVREIKHHLEEQINAQTALLVVQLVLETPQHVILACQAMVLIILQALVLNVLAIKLLQEDKVPVHHALQDVVHAQIIRLVLAAILDMALIMEFALLV